MALDITTQVRIPPHHSFYSLAMCTVLRQVTTAAYQGSNIVDLWRSSWYYSTTAKTACLNRMMALRWKFPSHYFSAHGQSVIINVPSSGIGNGAN